MRHQARPGKGRIKQAEGWQGYVKRMTRSCIDFKNLHQAQPQEANTSIHHLQPSITLTFHIFISDMLKTLQEGEEETEKGSALTLPVLFQPHEALQNLSYGGAEFSDILQEAVELDFFFFFYTPISNPFSPVVICL